MNSDTGQVEFEAVKDAEFCRLMRVRDALCNLIDVLNEEQDINQPNEIIDDESFTSYVIRADRYLSRMIDILVANDFEETEALEIIEMTREARKDSFGGWI